MKILSLCFLAVALSVEAQPSPYRLLQPIMKNPNQRQAPSSVTAADLGGQQQQQAAQQAAAPTEPPKPAVIVSKIDHGLAVSPVTVIARVTGIKGTIYVTNLSGDQVLPHSQFAVLDRNGVQLGVAKRLGSSLPAYGFERIDVIATNAGGTDLKLMTLSVK
jgi:hypothetical protein